MRPLLLSLITIALFTGGVSRAQGQFDGSLLSYNQLMSLSHGKRVAYLRKVRKLLVYLEVQERRHDREIFAKNDTTEIQKLREEIAELSRILSFEPEAEAETQPMKRLIVPYWNNGWRCDGLSSDQLVFNANVGTCTKPDYTGDVCSPGYHAAYIQVSLPSGPGIHQYCVPDDSWNALDDARRVSLSQPSGAYGDVADRYSKRSDVKRILAHLSKQDRAAALNGDTGPLPSQIEDAIHEQVGTPPEPPIPDFALKPAVKETGQKQKNQVTSSSRPPEKPIAKKVAPPKNAKVACELPKPSCTELKKGDHGYEAAREQARNINHCIAGGFFSTYKNPANKRLGCKIVTRFPKNAKEKCAAGQALCNPWLFSLELVPTGKGQTGISTTCVPEYDKKSGYDITVRCEKKFASQAKKFMDKTVAIGGHNYKVKSMDPKEVDADKTGTVKESWENLVNDTKGFLKTYCYDQGGGAPSFKDLYCNECQSIYQRIYAMNKTAIGTGCATSAPPVKGGVTVVPKTKAKAVR